MEILVNLFKQHFSPKVLCAQVLMLYIVILNLAGGGSTGAVVGVVIGIIVAVVTVTVLILVLIIIVKYVH